MAHVDHVPLAARGVAEEPGAVQAAPAPPHFLVQVLEQTVQVRNEPMITAQHR
jgi:hypothetical protein